MISRNQVKLIRSLQQKKFREEHGLFIVEGLRSIQEALRANASIESIFWTEAFSEKNSNHMNTISAVQNESILMAEMKQLSPSTTPPGVLAVCKIPIFDSPDMNRNFIYLDHISDPGNMGTILRTALWFGIHNIVLSEACIDPFNPKVVRGAMGAHFHISWIGTMPLCAFTDYTVLGADYRGNSILAVKKIPDKWVLVMGSEAHGISSDVHDELDQLIAIPKVGTGESLNVGVSMGILLHCLTT
ncbi:MAG: RNA methyltransferase [Candidatus Marinimicrobia bacterium]|jgi:TrmH family RNA methyltransferase|nr:RNA methyltransferase [Candidatus Neomarinimicrobiota bacterium]MDP6754621.1 RNA methyltransferase [Candidatus Neomarinimicrobiota bacterium]